jgi:hypothetical protein
VATLTASGIDMAWDCAGNGNTETILLIAGPGAHMLRWPVPFCATLAIIIVK